MNDLFSDLNSDKPVKSATLFCDGGSRGNPGPAGCGGALFDANKKEIGAYYEFLGHQTNNFAEYTGLILGLKKALELDITHLKVCMDSKLAIEQMGGNWKVKHPDIKKLWEQAKLLCEDFIEVTYAHVPREKNKRADALANKAMDLG